MVSSELGVDSLERRVSVGLWLLDTIHPSSSVSCTPALHIPSTLFPHALLIRLEMECVRRGVEEVVEVAVMRTRSCGSSWPGYAETSSWILRVMVSI